jgi:hypothetical protein
VCEREREIVRLPSSPLSLLLWDRTAAAGVVVSGKVVTGELKRRAGEISRGAALYVIYRLKCDLERWACRTRVCVRARARERERERERESGCVCVRASSFERRRGGN